MARCSAQLVDGCSKNRMALAATIQDSSQDIFSVAKESRGLSALPSDCWALGEGGLRVAGCRLLSGGTGLDRCCRYRCAVHLVEPEGGGPYDTQ